MTTYENIRFCFRGGMDVMVIFPSEYASSHEDRGEAIRVRARNISERIISQLLRAIVVSVSRHLSGST